MPKSDTWYKSGPVSASGNRRGRPKGAVGGRAAALMLLDKVLSKEKNKKLLEIALGKEFRADPMKFFRQIIMPLLPKEQILKMEGQDKAPIRISITGGPAAEKIKKVKL